MTDNEILEEIKPFIDACDKMASSKFIMIDKRIGDLLKSIAKTDVIFELIKECMINFNFEAEWKMATSKVGYLVAPDEPHRFIAFVFSLLNCLDDKKLNASELLSKCFSKSELAGGPYADFCETYIVRFKNTVINKLLNKTDVEEIIEKKTKAMVDTNKDVLTRLAFLSKDLRDYVQGLKKLKKSPITKGELLEIINGLVIATKSGDVKYVKSLVLAIKSGKGKDKELSRRLIEISDIVNNALINS